MHAYHRLVHRVADRGVLAAGADVTRPPGNSHHSVAAVPWIAIAPPAVAKFKYPAECSEHRCPGHRNKVPLCYTLSTVGTVLAELYPALKTHLHEHHGGLALLAPHRLATDEPQVWAPNAEQGIWFDELPLPATLRGTIAAVDAGTTLGGMALVGEAPAEIPLPPLAGKGLAPATPTPLCC